MKLHKWDAEGQITPEEKQLFVDGVVAELLSQGGAGYAVYVADDTLIFGSIDDNGSIDVFETKIVASNQTHSDIIDHATAAQMGKGMVS